jgi:predicted ATPase
MRVTRPRRRKFRPPISLTRLSRLEGAALITRTAAGKALPDEVTNQILARTDGVPLFVEELTMVVIESGLLQERDQDYVLDSPLLPLAIPTTLHASLMARLDRLGSVRELAQIGAALGRQPTIACINLWCAESPGDKS